MSTAASLQNTADQSPLVSKPSHAGLLLQRKCAYGSSASSLTGECEACKKKRLQKKLSIGTSNDPLEQEADRVADQVLAAPAHSVVSPAPPHIQRFTGQASGDGSTAPASVDRVLASSGRPLNGELQQEMGQRFGHDFSHVRVHTGVDAEQSAQDVNAHAYTVGHNIVFGAGRFAPESHEGQRLLVHELTHVVQQSDSDGSSVAHPNRKPSLSPILHSRPLVIQRSVQETGVSSPESVLFRIRRVLRLSAAAPIPAQLAALGYEFNPGGGEDNPSNAFVYTCKGGWIDLGHFFLTAAGASTYLVSAAGPLITWKKAIQTEEQQQREREKFEGPERVKYFGSSWKEAKEEKEAGRPEKVNRRGIAWSAYTIEDLPSDKFGFEFGRNLRPFSNIFMRMAEFFRRQGAVDASGGHNKDVRKRMMIETLGSEDPEKLPRQNRSTNPVLLASARELCGPR